MQQMGFYYNDNALYNIVKSDGTVQALMTIEHAGYSRYVSQLSFKLQFLMDQRMLPPIRL